MDRIAIEGERGPYTVHIGDNTLSEALPTFVAERGYTSVAIVTNETVAPLFDPGTLLPGSHLIVLPDGEAYKTLATVQTIYDELLAAGADRRTLLITLGGGVIGDMGGFAAASFMRGIDFVQAPTTLLAMVDASVGGKVGVNLPQGKNLVGAFYDPLAVFADMHALNVLMKTNALQYSFGMAEVIKHGLLADPWLLDYPRSGTQQEMVTRAVRVKAEIVEQDRTEQGVRAHLNLGHTFAHAIERVSAHQCQHGQAVAIGLAAAARLSVRLGLAEEQLIQDVVNRLAGWNLLYQNYWDPDAIWQAMRHDKKWRDGVPRFVLLEDTGQPLIVEGVAREDVVSVLDEMMVSA